uniref:Uncharacterized protein n=1 Tax=Tetranychus urticae TaxID=32264 RepID=T1KY98_TETUR
MANFWPKVKKGPPHHTVRGPQDILTGVQPVPSSLSAAASAKNKQLALKGQGTSSGRGFHATTHNRILPLPCLTQDMHAVGTLAGTYILKPDTSGIEPLGFRAMLCSCLAQHASICYDLPPPSGQGLSKRTCAVSA